MSHLRCDLPIQDCRYLALGHTTSGDLGRMEGLAAREDREICWSDFYGESNPVRSHVITMVYPPIVIKLVIV